MRGLKAWGVGLAVAAVLVVAGGPAAAEPVLGCPLGLDKDVVWVRTAYKYVDHTDRFDPKSGSMEGLPEGWHSRKTTLMVRLGYGVTQDTDVGLVLPYSWRDTRVQQKGKWVEKDASGVEDIWLAAKYKFLESDEPKGDLLDQHACVALAYRFDSAGDEKCRNGLGTGARAWRIGLLGHAAVLPKTDLCSHLTYDIIGDARTIDGFGKSGYDYANRIGYKLFVERALSDTWAVVGGPIGWFEVRETKDATGKGVGYRARSHSLALKIEHHPNGVEIEHQKFALGLSMPYSVKNKFAAKVTYTVLGMWIW